MKAYKKGTVHPYCIYLMPDELVELINEATEAINAAYVVGDEYPTLSDAVDRLNSLLLRQD